MQIQWNIYFNGIFLKKLEVKKIVFMYFKRYMYATIPYLIYYSMEKQSHLNYLCLNTGLNYWQRKL